MHTVHAQENKQSRMEAELKSMWYADTPCNHLKKFQYNIGCHTDNTVIVPNAVTGSIRATAD